VHSFPAFLAVAAAVTLTPGPAFALLVQTAAVSGRRAALATLAGNALGVVAWGALSAVGVSALVAASRLAYDVLRGAGAAYLVWLGVRALRARRTPGTAEPPTGAGRRQVLHAARRGAVSALANPKLAVFFVALLPQFLDPGAAVLPAALAMAGTVVGCDVVCYGTVAVLVDRFRTALRPRVLRAVERCTGVVLLGFGVRLATEARPA
jgi:threonine/homoserine/homoserine lactone efflux protein